MPDLLPQERKASELSHPQTVARLLAIQEEMDRLAARTDLTEADEKHWNEIVVEFDELESHRKNLERAADISRVRAVVASGVGSSERGTPVNPFDGYDVDTFREPNSAEDVRFKKNPWDVSEVKEWGRDRNAVAVEYRARALAAIERMPCANDGVRQAATQIIESFDDSDAKLARLCLATSSPAYMRAWSKLARGAGHEITRDEQDALSHTRQSTRAMSLTDAAGGYLVPFQLDPTVIITSAGSLNQIRRVARQVVATGDVWNGVSAGQVTWAFAAEATEASDNAPTFAQPTINLFKAQGFVPISIEALEDEANVAAEVARLLAFGREALESDKLINGSGTNEPRGVITSIPAPQQVTAASATALVIGDIYKPDNALPARYRASAAWLAHRVIYNVIRQFDTAGGAGLWVQLQGDVPGQMIGRGAYEAEAMSSALTTGQKVLLYGDFENYVIADRIGMTVEFIPHLVGTNRRPTGQRGWYAYYRVGADTVNVDGFRLLKMA